MQNAETPLVDEKLVRWHFGAGLVCLLLSMLGGLSYSFQFLGGYPFPGMEWLSPGRVRMLHTNMIAYGWIVNAFIGGLRYVVPKLTDWPPALRKLSWAIFLRGNWSSS